MQDPGTISLYRSFLRGGDESSGRRSRTGRLAGRSRTGRLAGVGVGVLDSTWKDWGSGWALAGGSVKRSRTGRLAGRWGQDV